MNNLTITRLEQAQENLPIGTQLTIALEKDWFTATEVTHTYTATVQKHYKDGSILLSGRRAKCYIGPRSKTVHFWGERLRYSSNVIIDIEKPAIDAALSAH